MFKNAEKFIKKYNLTQKNLSYNYLKQIFESLGYETVFFSEYDNQPNIQYIIDMYKLQKLTASSKSFILENDIVKVLFLHEHVGEDELIHYMLHELGHIWLNHSPYTYNKEKKEREADEFAVLVKIFLKYRYFCCTAAIVITSLLLIVIIAIPRKGVNNVAKPITLSTLAPVQNDVHVFVTKSGEKYHLPDCQYVENKTNIFKMTEQEALDAGYEPCAVCRPDK